MTLAKQSMEQMYSLRGLDMITPDQLIDTNPATIGKTPYAINFRVWDPTAEDEPRTSIDSRKGVGFYTVPVGEALDTQNTTTTGQAALATNYLSKVAQRFTPANAKALTALELLVQNNGANDNIIVEVYEDVAGNFGTKVAISSIARSQVLDTYTYTKVRFPQAPTLDTAKNYWIVVSCQEPTTTSNYSLSRTTTGANLMTSADGGTTWAAATGSINFKTYLSTPGQIIGHHRFVTKTGLKQTLFAFKSATDVSIYQVTNESTGAVAAIKTGLSTNTTRVRMVTVYDKVFITTGYDAMGKWDGTTYTSSTHTVDFPIPDNVIIYHDRAWYYSKSEPTKLYFSELYPDLETVLNVNYQYVPDTASPDPLTGFVVFQDQLVLFTKESKYLLLGDDVSTLGLAQSPGGTKGAVSQEAISLGEKVVYFWSIDGGGYFYDGAQDRSLTDPIKPVVDSMANLDQMDATVTDREWRVYFRETGDSAHANMLSYDLRYSEWALDTETYTRLPITWVLENNELVEASSTVGCLYFGEAQDSNLGAPIRFKYWTNYKKYTSGIAKDRVRTFRVVFSSPDRTITVKVGKDADFDNDTTYKNVLLATSGILYDGGETYGSATATYGQGARVSQPKIALSGRASNTQYRFEKDVIGQPVKIYGYEAIIKSGRPR